MLILQQDSETLPRPTLAELVGEVGRSLLLRFRFRRSSAPAFEGGSRRCEAGR